MISILSSLAIVGLYLSSVGSTEDPESGGEYEEYIWISAGAGFLSWVFNALPETLQLVTPKRCPRCVGLAAWDANDCPMCQKLEKRWLATELATWIFHALQFLVSVLIIVVLALRVCSSWSGTWAILSTFALMIHLLGFEWMSAGLKTYYKSRA